MKVRLVLTVHTSLCPVQGTFWKEIKQRSGGREARPFGGHSFNPSTTFTKLQKSNLELTSRHCKRQKSHIQLEPIHSISVFIKPKTYFQTRSQFAWRILSELKPVEWYQLSAVLILSSSSMHFYKYYYTWLNHSLYKNRKQVDFLPLCVHFSLALD